MTTLRSFYSETSPVGQDRVDVYNWNSRRGIFEAVARMAPEPEYSSISSLSQKEDSIKLGSGDYYGGQLSDRSSTVPVVISGAPGLTWVKTPLVVNGQNVIISGVGFDMAQSGEASIVVKPGSKVVISGCVFKADEHSTANVITMENTSGVSITGSTFYGGPSSARIVSGGFVLGDLVIATSHRTFGAAWASGPFVGIGNIS